jgi:glycosyltransferase involved in cell wall biosynthesis
MDGSATPAVTARCTIVVPCYNEAARFSPERFARFSSAYPSVRFVLVDDGSTDATGAMLGALCARDALRFELMTLPRNVGQGEAVRAGITRAFSSGARYVGYWDADLATPLEEIPRFVEVLERDAGCLLVIGSRQPASDNRVRRHPLRYALGRAFAFSASMLLRMRVYDTQCGAKLFRRSAEVEALFSSAFVSRWIFDVELLVRLIRHKGSTWAARAAVHELRLHTWRDVEGSKLRPLDFARAPWELLKIGVQLYR